MLAYGTEYIALILVAVALIATAAILLSIKKPSVANSQDDRVMNYATRGTYIPLVVGRDLLGAVHLWSQPDEPVGVGNPPAYQEAGLHAIAVGPATALHAIYKDGKKVWSGPITPQTHPSGTSITVPDLGVFVPYWGFDDDPTIGVMDAASNYGFATRLPLVFKILWNKLELGNVKRWPVLEYESEFPCRFPLANSPVCIPPQCQDGSSPNFPALTWSDIVNTVAHDPLNPPVFGPGLANRVKPKLLLVQGKSPDDSLWVLGSPGSLPNSALLVDDSSKFFYPLGNPNGIPQHAHFERILSNGEAIKLFGNTPYVLPQSLFPALPSNQTVPNLDIGALFDGAAWSVGGEFLTVSNSTYISNFVILCWSNSQNRIVYICSPNHNVTPPAGVTPLMAWKGAVMVTFGSRVTVTLPESEANNLASACILRPRDHGGVNPISIACQLLFSPFPYGAGKDIASFDRQSIEECGYYLSFKEPYRAYMTCTDGETADNALSRLCQDIGLLIPFDPATGKYFFKLVRNPDEEETLPTITEGLLISKTSNSNTRGLQPVDKAMFTFMDENINYRDQPIVFDDDGNAVLSRTQGSETVQITTTSSYPCALIAATRRSQEILSNHNAVEIEGNHALRFVYPGLAFESPASVDSGGAPLRVVSITRDSDNSKVKIAALVDNYDPPKPAGLVGGGGFLDTYPIESSLMGHEISKQPDPRSPPARAQAHARFAPRGLGGGLWVLRTRTSDDILVAWASRDGVSYSQVGIVRDGCFYGRLTETLFAGQEDSVGVSLTGHEADEAQRVDLSLREAEWHLGRQIALVGDELVYVRRVSHVEGDSWVLEGLLRGRQLTSCPEQWPAGTPVWAFSNAPRLNSLLFVPGEPVHIKLQRRARGFVEPLEGLEPLVLRCP